jgi:hypothetical protein
MRNVIDTSILLSNYNELPIAILSTQHFREALDNRVFPLNVVGSAAIQAVNLNIGETKEIFSSKKHKATVELKRVSENVALLLTGWKGLRNSINQTKTN